MNEILQQLCRIGIVPVVSVEDAGKAVGLANALAGVNMDDYESLQYFQRVLIQSGIIKKLEDMGINEGDTVSILDFEFEYVK